MGKKEEACDSTVRLAQKAREKVEQGDRDRRIMWLKRIHFSNRRKRQSGTKATLCPQEGYMNLHQSKQTEGLGGGNGVGWERS